MSDNQMNSFIGRTFTTSIGQKIKVVRAINSRSVEIEFENGSRKIVGLDKLKNMIKVYNHRVCYKYTTDFINVKISRKRISLILFLCCLLPLIFHKRLIDPLFYGTEIEGIITLILIICIIISLIVVGEGDREYDGDHIYIEAGILYFNKCYRDKFGRKIKRDRVAKITKIIVTDKWIEVYGDASIQYMIFDFRSKKISIPNHIENREEFINDIGCIIVK